MKENTVQIKVKGAKYIVTDINYHLGGYNWATHEQDKRGYKVTVTPEEIGESFRTVSAFSGYKHFVHEVKRKSDKAYVEAVRKVVEEEIDMVGRMVQAVCMQEALSKEETQRIIDETREKLMAHYEYVKS
jgi:hypothetical protein